MKTIEQRFLDKVNITKDCWLWEGCLTQAGYGQIIWNGKVWYSHRVAYTLFIGPIPTNLQLDHLCRTRKCVNPTHLEPVTNKENTSRGRALILLCPKKHEYTRENTYKSPKGERRCRECHRVESRERYRELGRM